MNRTCHTRPVRSILLVALLSSLGSLFAASNASAVMTGLSFSTLDNSEDAWQGIQHSGTNLYRLNVTWKTVTDHGNWRESPAWQQSYDQTFEQAAKHGVQVMVDLYGRKTEGALHQFYLTTGQTEAEKTEYTEYKEFVLTVVQRYGRNGTFWAAHSSLPYLPVTVWEVWNEPNLPLNNPGENVLPQKYAEFLISISNTVKNAQNAVRKAGEPNDTKVLHAGLLRPFGSDVATYINEAHKVSGYGASFDGLGLHPYSFDGTESQKVAGVQSNIEAARTALNEFVDSGKPIWITELGWPLGGEGATSVGLNEQASLMKKSFNWIKSNAAAYKVELVTWFAYTDYIDGTKDKWAQHCGLRDLEGEYRPSWWAFLEQTGAPTWPVEGLSVSQDKDKAPGPHAIVEPGTNDVHVFYRTPSGKLGHNWYDMATHNGWGGEVLNASVASSAHAIVDSAGGINVFFRTSIGGLGHEWWEASAKEWRTELLTGEVAGEPDAIVEPGTNDVHVFYRTPSGKLGHNWYDMATHNGWGGEVLNASVASNAHPIIDNAGGINVFFRTSIGGLGHEWWEASAKEWRNELLTGEVASEPQPIVEPGTNDVHLFYRTPSGQLGHNWYDMATHNGWGGEVLNASVASNAHPIVDSAGGINVFYRRTSTGGLGHEWWEASAKEWRNEVLTGEVAATAPRAVTGSTTEISDTKATLNATVNPEGSLTSYYIEYGTSIAYGTKQPISGENVPLGYSDFPVSQTVSGLTAVTTYHYRVVATSPEGTSYGEDKTFKTEASGTTGTKLANMPVTEPFDGSTESVANFGSKWSALGWAAGTTPKGQDTTSGWGPSNAYSTINGAYYTTALSGSELAAVARMTTNPGNTQRYFSLWLDMPTPASTRAGYELRFTNTATNTYEVTLSKWVGGTQTVLASKTGYSFLNGNSFAVVDQGGTVSAWTDTGSGFGQLLSAPDSAFSSGNAGLHGAGNITRLAKFKAGSL